MELKLAELKVIPQRMVDYDQDDTLKERKCYTAGFKDGTEAQAEVTVRQVVDMFDSLPQSKSTDPGDMAGDLNSVWALVEQLREVSHN